MYLSTVLDDFSRYIIAWKLCTNMRPRTSPTRWTSPWRLGLRQRHGAAQAAAAQRQWSQLHRGRTGRIYRGPEDEPCARRPDAPQTQGKIERWHQTLKNRILLENYFLPGDLEAQIEAFVEHYNHQRYHESLNNVTPADAYFGRAPAIIKQRERIKRQTIEHRRLQHRKLAA
jgi:transposase InsO family protein